MMQRVKAFKIMIPWCIINVRVLLMFVYFLVFTHTSIFSISDTLSLSKEGCKKHELYVSFRDLGWQVWFRSSIWSHFISMSCPKGTRGLHLLDALIQPGLDHRPRGLRGVLLRGRMCLPSQLLHERHQSCHRANSGKSQTAVMTTGPFTTTSTSCEHWCTPLPSTGALYQPGHGAKAVLRPHPAPRHLSALLWRQLQRHPQEVPQHGGQILRLPLTAATPPCEFVTNLEGRWRKAEVNEPERRWLTGWSSGSSCHELSSGELLLWAAAEPHMQYEPPPQTVPNCW